jgi:hypothetical protein
MIPAAHMPTEPRAARGSALFRANALDEPGSPDIRTPTDLLLLADWLAVEQSARWRPTSTATYCNVYAHDFCHKAGVYLPRVWWSPDAISRFARNEAVNGEYGRTLFEQNANALHDWFKREGSGFGWRQTDNLGALQHTANNGHVGIIVAKRADVRRSGHITVVLPESPRQHALRIGQHVIAPVQSQAGTTNKRIFAEAWWDRSSVYQSYAFWWHQEKLDTDPAPPPFPEEDAEDPAPIADPRLMPFLDLSSTTGMLAAAKHPEAVEILQGRLNIKGASPRLDIDGDPGSLTAAALEAFQRRAGLTFDRKCGPITWGALFA